MCDRSQKVDYYQQNKLGIEVYHAIGRIIYDFTQSE